MLTGTSLPQQGDSLCPPKRSRDVTPFLSVEVIRLLATIRDVEDQAKGTGEMTLVRRVLKPSYSYICNYISDVLFVPFGLVMSDKVSFGAA